MAQGLLTLRDVQIASTSTPSAPPSGPEAGGAAPGAAPGPVTAAFPALMLLTGAAPPETLGRGSAASEADADGGGGEATAVETLAEALALVAGTAAGAVAPEGATDGVAGGDAAADAGAADGTEGALAVVGLDVVAAAGAGSAEAGTDAVVTAEGETAVVAPNGARGVATAPNGGTFVAARAEAGGEASPGVRTPGAPAAGAAASAGAPVTTDASSDVPAGRMAPTTHAAVEPEPQPAVPTAPAAVRDRGASGAGDPAFARAAAAGASPAVGAAIQDVTGRVNAEEPAGDAPSQAATTARHGATADRTGAEGDGAGEGDARDARRLFALGAERAGHEAPTFRTAGVSTPTTALRGEAAAQATIAPPPAPPAGDGGQARGVAPPSAAEPAAPPVRAVVQPTLPPIVDRLVDALRLTPMRDGAEMRVQLEPEGLGHLDVRVSVQPDGVRAVVVAEHEATRALLIAQQHLLESALARSDLRLAGFSIDLSGGGASGFAEGDGARAGTEATRPNDDPPPATASDPDPLPHLPGRLSLRV